MTNHFFFSPSSLNKLCQNVLGLQQDRTALRNWCTKLVSEITEADAVPVDAKKHAQGPMGQMQSVGEG